MPQIDLSSTKLAPRDPNAITPSPLQSAIFEAIGSTDFSLIIEAVAGSGKTWTIVESCKYIDSFTSTLFLAFNKSIQTELEKRLPSHIKAFTFHSYCLSAIRTALGHHPEVNFRKVQHIMDDLCPSTMFTKKFGDKLAFQKLISFAKGNGHKLGPTPTPVDWLQLIDYHDLEFEAPAEKYFPYLTKVFEESWNATTCIDFDDMLLHPVVHNYEFTQFDNIIVDEAQDLNSLQHEILSRARKGPHARIIAVGDTHQAIYGFRGADSSSMGNLKETFEMEELPLNVSYRCSKAVAHLSKQQVSHFECLPDAPEGSVNHILELPEPSEVDLDTMVLCRLNAPLFKYGMSFLTKGVRVQLWTNLDKQLRSRIKSFKASKTKQWRSLLTHWFEGEKDKALEEDKPHRVQGLVDVFETLMALSENTTSVQQIDRNLTDLVDSKQGPILSTIHKAKGHEAENCLIINFNQMPSRFATKRWMLQQEHNLIYVAITRAQN